MPAYEERQQLMEAASTLTQELRSLNKKVNDVINKLIEQGDALAIEAADEQSSLDRKRAKNITYAKAYGASDEKVEEVIAAKGQRACGTCGELGHNKRTCPKADEAYRAARGKGKKK